MASTADNVTGHAAAAASALKEADSQGETAKVVIVEAMCAVDELAQKVRLASAAIVRPEKESEYIVNIDRLSKHNQQSMAQLAGASGQVSHKAAELSELGGEFRN